MSIAVHDRLPVLAMAYSDILNVWATATYNEISFVRWKRSDCEFLITTARAEFSLTGLQGHTFYARPEDRIIAKRVVVSSEEERPVIVTSLNWIKKSSTVAHLVVAFLHHHVEYVAPRPFYNQPLTPIRIIDGETRSVLTHVAIHTPVYVLL